MKKVITLLVASVLAITGTAPANAVIYVNDPVVSEEKVVSENIAKVVFGFEIYSSVLTDDMKDKIKRWVKRVPRASTYTLVGYTMGPIAEGDEVLAKARATAVKKYILTLDKNAKFKLSGKPDSRVGDEIRRVHMKATYKVVG